MKVSLDSGLIVAVRPDPASLYTIPAEICEDHGDEITVRFAAGNEKRVKLSQLKPASRQDLEEFETGLKLWNAGKLAS
jgi:hypothetical protein